MELRRDGGRDNFKFSGASIVSCERGNRAQVLTHGHRALYPRQYKVHQRFRGGDRAR